MDIPVDDYLDYGVLGLTIVVLLGLAVWQQKRIDDRDKTIADLQEKRIVETNVKAREITDILREVIKSGSDTLNSVNLMQKTVESSVETIRAVQSLLNNK